MQSALAPLVVECFIFDHRDLPPRPPLHLQILVKHAKLS